LAAQEMSTAAKLEQRVKELRNLPDNRTCFITGQRGPTYVDLNTGTFIVTNVAGALRDLSHRVKSLQAANFTVEEVKKLEESGNDVARMIWLARWDEARLPRPDATNMDDIKRFVGWVYRDKRFYDPAGEQAARAKLAHSAPAAQPVESLVGGGLPKLTVSPAGDSRRDRRVGTAVRV
jgi:hypothetical protein